MPTYRYRCPTCGGEEDVFKKLADIDNPVHCGCNLGRGTKVEMERVICAPAVVGDYPGYSCPVSGAWIEGRRQHEENLAKHGCRVFEPGEREAVLRNREADDRAFDAMIENTAGELVASLSPEKQERLACEISHGIDAVVTRN